MVVMPIERGKIREYSRAMAADRAAYVDDPAAPVPPTFLATVVFWASIGETVNPPEVVEVCHRVGIEAEVRNVLCLEPEHVFPDPSPERGRTSGSASGLRM